MATHITISSSLPAMAIDATTSYITFMQEASNLLEHEDGRRIVLLIDCVDADRRDVPIWIFRIPDAAIESLESAAVKCSNFCESSNRYKPTSLVVPFYRRSARPEDSTQRLENFLLVASRSLSLASDTEDDDIGHLRNRPSGIGILRRFFGRGCTKRGPEYRYESLSSDKGVSASSRRNRNIWPAMGVIIMAVFILVIVLRGNHRFAGQVSGVSIDTAETAATEWHRYLPGASIGPKNQLRIQWHNATDWGYSNPHQNGEWAIRMDDQSLIPAQYLDKDESDRQTFFRARYPHMAAVIDARDYIRPAWLGSKSVLVEWDHTFHDAHCVMALRRYFKAKETGHHVCPRDIDPGHILHCLNMLEKTIFTSGSMVSESPPNYMYWETKVCF